jgi:hypothetical protein
MNTLKATLLVSLASTSLALAGTLTYDGDTTGQPVWNRPLQNGPLAPDSLSLVGTATPYQTVNFTVSQFGTYDFMSTATVPPGWDNYGFLYAGNFDPSMPLANALIGADDSPNIGLAGFSYDLFPGTSYYFATTGFGNTDFGQYTLSIRGPGDITLVPEPGQIAMMALTVLGAVSYGVRRFRTTAK